MSDEREEKDETEEWSTNHPLHGKERPRVMPLVVVLLVLAALVGLFVLITLLAPDGPGAPGSLGGTATSPSPLTELAG